MAALPPPLQKVLDALKAEPGEAPPPVRFIPAPYFFVHTEALPEGMQPGELRGFVEVTLEGLAPMPLETLAWGFLADEHCRHVFIFAAARDRLTSEKLEVDETFFHVLPSFFAATPPDGAARWVFLWEVGFVVGLHYQSGEPVPSRMELERVTEDTVPGAFAARDRLLKRLGNAARPEAAPGVLVRPDATRAGENLEFFYDYYSAPETEATRVEGFPPPNDTSRWSADLRDPLFRDSEQHRRRDTRRSTRILQVAGALALTLFVLQLVWVGGWFWLSASDKRIAKQKITVNSIQDNQALLAKIELFSEHQLRPFEMLGWIQPTRPRGVIYKETKFLKNDTLSATMDAQDPASARQFLDEISQISYLTVTNTPLQQKGTGHITFGITAKFKQLPPYEPMPPDPPPAPPQPPPPTPEEIAAANAAAAAANESGPDQFRGGPPNNQPPGPPPGPAEETEEAAPPAPPPAPQVYSN